MNKNQKTYLLLFAVALVWGAIGYQFFTRYKINDPVITTNQVVKPYQQEKKQAVNYTIQPDYRDPFLGKIYRKKHPVNKKITSSKPKVIFPKILYNGSINGSTKSYIISINGVQEVFQLKQTMKGITLVKANEREITLKYQGETKKYLLLQ